jgi:hypothetical protein
LWYDEKTINIEKSWWLKRRGVWNFHCDWIPLA